MRPGETTTTQRQEPYSVANGFGQAFKDEMRDGRGNQLIHRAFEALSSLLDNVGGHRPTQPQPQEQQPNLLTPPVDPNQPQSVYTPPGTPIKPTFVSLSNLGADVQHFGEQAGEIIQRDLKSEISRLPDSDFADQAKAYFQKEGIQLPGEIQEVFEELKNNSTPELRVAAEDLLSKFVDRFVGYVQSNISNQQNSQRMPGQHNRQPMNY